jgi:hypothetical protein
MDTIQFYDPLLSSTHSRCKASSSLNRPPTVVPRCQQGNRDRITDGDSTLDEDGLPTLEKLFSMWRKEADTGNLANSKHTLQVTVQRITSEERWF